MKEVFFVFRLIEICFGMVCFGAHICGVIIHEKIRHIMIFCGTYFGFSYCALILNIGLFFNNNIPLILEMTVTSLATVSYLISSVLTMYFAEKDTHLMFLSAIEEALHPFFYISRIQSTTALIAGMFFLLHFLLAADKYFVKGTKKIDEFEKYEESDIHFVTRERKIFLKIMPNSWRDRLIQFKYVDRLFDIPPCDCKEVEKIKRMEIK